ncbi:hypothetical protein AN639_06135 [Candidatus Epulonipiscium fishelsonii]|uniref:Uncharacterized protein n=1 Tax=Candidatus Epulonipiscium fishelsonii TaxID=77094 RepID=A0ACC8XER8_9FIRM|nr:hypothetical protein AN639_06135 [Epulopiscium sp. SCG-B05WGA-EpuloA1]ONI41698.1 hypothetical protein AN396_03275 [Epulopiscium sp. SCG-B11WGA-EpuloA1]
MKVKGLGNGVNALFMDDMDEILIESASEDTNILIDNIFPNKNQPRKVFDEDSLDELAASIKEHGILQPILVTPINGKYQIVAGERRYRAAKLAGLEHIPVIVKDLTAEEVATIALIENIQRKNLNIVEIAEAYKYLIDNFGITQEQLAIKVGKKRSSITNILRINELSNYIKEKLLNNEISFSHAKVILSVEDLEKQRKFTDYIIKNNLNVKQSTEYIERYKEEIKHPLQYIEGYKERADQKDNTTKIIDYVEIYKEKNNYKNTSSEIPDEVKIYYKQIESILKNTLGTNVKLTTTNKQHEGKAVSKIEIEYYSKEQLENIIRLMEPNNIIN